MRLSILFLFSVVTGHADQCHCDEDPPLQNLEMKVQHMLRELLTLEAQNDRNYPGRAGPPV